MRKLLLSMVLLFTMSGAIVVNTVEAHHMSKGQEISSFLFCKTPDEAVVSMKLLIAAKTRAQFQPYREYIEDSDNTCIDTRAAGIPGFPFSPVEKLTEYTLLSDMDSFVLWRGTLFGKMVYAWESHEVRQA